MIPFFLSIKTCEEKLTNKDKHELLEYLFTLNNRGIRATLNFGIRMVMFCIWENDEISFTACIGYDQSAVKRIELINNYIEGLGVE